MNKLKVVIGNILISDLLKIILYYSIDNEINIIQSTIPLLPIFGTEIVPKSKIAYTYGPCDEFDKDWNNNNNNDGNKKGFRKLPKR